jgi:hypothetical protein
MFGYLLAQLLNFLCDHWFKRNDILLAEEWGEGFTTSPVDFMANSRTHTSWNSKRP